MWTAFNGAHQAIPGTHAYQKIRKFRRDARIGTSVCDEPNPYRSLIIRRRVVEKLDRDEA